MTLDGIREVNFICSLWLHTSVDHDSTTRVRYPRRLAWPSYSITTAINVIRSSFHPDATDPLWRGWKGWQRIPRKAAELGDILVYRGFLTNVVIAGWLSAQAWVHWLKLLSVCLSLSKISDAKSIPTDRNDVHQRSVDLYFRVLRFITMWVELHIPPLTMYHTTTRLTGWGGWLRRVTFGWWLPPSLLGPASLTFSSEPSRQEYPSPAEAPRCHGLVSSTRTPSCPPTLAQRAAVILLCINMLLCRRSTGGAVLQTVRIVYHRQAFLTEVLNSTASYCLAPTSVLTITLPPTYIQTTSILRHGSQSESQC